MSKSKVDYTTTDIVIKHDSINLDRVWSLIEEEAKLFEERTPKSAEIFARSKQSMINGTPMSWWQQWRLPIPGGQVQYIMPHNWYWSKGKNQKAWDADGNEYVDYFLAETPSIWGHCPDDNVTAGLIDYIQNEGLASMVPTEDAHVATELLQKLIGLKYWYITLSASDADRNAISIARTVTGRAKVLTHHLGYMGLNEEGMYWQPVPNGPVVPRWPHYGSPKTEPTACFCEFNDLESVEEALKNRDVAIFITEPMLTDSGLLAAEPGYLEGCYELCQKYGTLFLIDETHTLTHAYNGMYGDLGLQADMWVTGKAVGGGVACGVLGMSEQVGDAYGEKLNDFTADWGIGSLTGQGTTLSANGLSVRALRLALENYYTPETYSKMVGAMDHLVAGLNEMFKKHNAPLSMIQSGARSHINVTATEPKTTLEAMLASGWGGYHEYMTLFALNRGFVPNPWFNMLMTSPYHTEEDNNRFIAVMEECVANMMR